MKFNIIDGYKVYQDMSREPFETLITPLRFHSEHDVDEREDYARYQQLSVSTVRCNSRELKHRTYTLQPTNAYDASTAA